MRKCLTNRQKAEGADKHAKWIVQKRTRSAGECRVWRYHRVLRGQWRKGNGLIPWRDTRREGIAPGTAAHRPRRPARHFHPTGGSPHANGALRFRSWLHGVSDGLLREVRPMANLASFDENGLRQKLTESREGIEEVGENGIQTDTDLYELLDGIDTGVSAAIALV